MITYVLDSNIIIKLLNDSPQILDLIENCQELEYIVTNEVLMEVVNGENEPLSSLASPKYRKLMSHRRNADFSSDGGREKTPFLVDKIDGKPVVLIGNRITYIDLSSIIFCQNNPECTLVTNDKKMLKNSSKVLGKDRILNYNDFIEQLASRGLFE